MSRSGRQRGHCCLVCLIFNYLYICQDIGKGGPALEEYNVMFYDARQIIQSADGDGRRFIIIIIIIIKEVVLFNTLRRK